MRVRLTVMRLGRTVTSVPVQGRWTGEPVRIRCGPATVTGDAERRRLIRAAATGPPRADPGRRARWAREPGDLPPTAKPRSPRGKGWLNAQALVRPGGRDRAARRGAGGPRGERRRAGRGDGRHARPTLARHD